VERFLAADPLIVAHNAWFDRPFFERRFPQLDNLRWACSCRGLDWSQHGFEGAGLGPLLMQAGFFFEGHRAVDDCLALAWLLHREYGAFEEMVSTAAGLTYVVEAWKAPIRCKDELKGRKYQWDADRRVWHKADVVDLDSELDFLDALYECARKVAVYKPQTARERFKKALPRLVVASV
jgi:DNA polymerase-3 subunit epsilon